MRPPELTAAEQTALEERRNRAAHLRSHDMFHVIEQIERVVSLIDCARTARACADAGSVVHLLDKARFLALELLGIAPETSSLLNDGRRGTTLPTILACDPAQVPDQLGRRGDKGCAGCGRVVKPDEPEAQVIGDSRGRYWHVTCTIFGLATIPRPGERPFPKGNRCPDCGGAAEAFVDGQPVADNRAMVSRYELICEKHHRFIIERH
jgi:hypothetical protein